MSNFTDLTDVSLEEMKGVIAAGKAYVAENGLIVIVSNDEKTLYAVKGKYIKRRSHTKPVAKAWRTRHINAFAEHVKSSRAKAAPGSRRVRVKKKAA